MKRLWLCFALLLCVPGFTHAQGLKLGIGNGIGSSIGKAALNLTNGSKAISGITLTTGDYSIAGTVLDKNKRPIQEVLMTLTGDISTATKTDKKGKYIFASLDNGDYTITPSREGYTFAPKSRNVTITNHNKKKADFKGKKSRKTTPGRNNILTAPQSILTATSTGTGWPYGDPDEDGYYTINGYKVRFYDATNTIIMDVATNINSVAKIELFVDESYDVGSVSGYVFAETTIPVSYPLIFNGTLDLSMDSDQFGTLTGTVEIQDCTLESAGTFFSSGGLNVDLNGHLTTSQGYEVTYSVNGTLSISGNTFQGAVSLTYEVSGAPVEIGNTVNMTLTINAEGSGEYSSEDENVGSGSF